MIIENEEQIIKNVIYNIVSYYDKEHEHLVNVAQEAVTEGEIRYAAGELVEKLLGNIFSTLNRLIPTASIISKVGSSDFLKLSITYKNQTLTNNRIQVDRHVFSKNKRICFIENKTYLDSCYYDRALADFKKIIQAIKQEGKEPSEYSYIIFAGQNASNNEKLFFYEAEFFNDIKHLTKNETGVPMKIFFFLQGKRSSQKPWYKIKHPLDIQAIENFTKYIISLI